MLLSSPHLACKQQAMLQPGSTWQRCCLTPGRRLRQQQGTHVILELPVDALGGALALRVAHRAGDVVHVKRLAQLLHHSHELRAIVALQHCRRLSVHPKEVQLQELEFKR